MGSAFTDAVAAEPGVLVVGTDRDGDDEYE
jgi:hypothetical protein